ncbi:MAG: hypothetical protein ACNA8L_03520 [Luteolibacter sp.]
MVTQQYREANELADLLDFYEDASKSKVAKPEEFADLIARTRADLAEQERIDGKPADPREQRQEFLVAT